MYSQAKRVWMITDIHFGVRSNAQEWMDIQRDYFFNFFIPLAKSKYQPGDVLLILGDVFDNRQSIAIKAMHLALDVFEELANIFDNIIVFAGNHDVWSKSSNDINSLRPLTKIKGVTLYIEPEVIMLGKRSFLIMPWRKDHEAERECLLQYKDKAEYLACHCDINGLKFNKNVTVDDGCAISEYAGFKKVYSGHIHFSQDVANIKMLGSPYQMTRSDAYNKKGVTILNLETEKELYFENTYSPQFIRINLNDIIQMTPAQAKRICRNNMVDIVIDSETALRAPTGLLIELLDNVCRRIELQVVSKSQELPDIDIQTGSGFNLDSLMEAYVKEMPYEDDTKKKLYDSLKKLHQLAEQRTK